MHENQSALEASIREFMVRKYFQSCVTDSLYKMSFSGIPSCLGEDHTVCDYVRRMLNYGAYTSWIQSFVVQAEYWHDPLNEEEYRFAILHMSLRRFGIWRSPHFSDARACSSLTLTTRENPGT